ncbi:MAG: MBL fold metallo-hydrolase [Fusobacteriaceae bacterium]
MRISILGSGSSGNLTFIDAEGVKLLVDAGFSCKKIEERLSEIGEKLEDIDGILITHEHGDHILGAGIVSRKYNIPIYIAEKSYRMAEHKFGKLLSENLIFIDGKFKMKDGVLITPFDVLHDAERTLGYRIETSSGKVVSIATDIGYVDNSVKEQFKDVDIMVIECNYDYHMLMESQYPWDLKARVKGRNGHLSNSDSAKLIKDVYSERLKKVFLVHVSKDSNRYSLAIETVRDDLRGDGIEVDLEVAKQNEVTSVWEY